MKKTCMLILAMVLCVLLAACDLSALLHGGESEPTDSIKEPTNPTVPHVHEFGEWELVKKPTCTETGEEVSRCACGETKSKELFTVAHTFGEWEDTILPSCEQAGEKRRSCSCGETQMEKIPATGHNYSETERVNATLSKPGYVMYICTRCGGSHRKNLKAYGSKGLKYEIRNGECVILGMGSCKDEVLYIPDEIDGYPVRAIEDRAFYLTSNLKELYLPDSLTRIGDEAFYRCLNLEKIELPRAEHYIDWGEYIFFACSSLKTVTVPGNLYEVPGTLFYNCSHLEKVILEEGVGIIGPNAFGMCNIKEITIPSTIHRLCQYALGYNSHLEVIEFNETIEGWKSLIFDWGWDIGSDGYIVRCTDGDYRPTH